MALSVAAIGMALAFAGVRGAVQREEVDGWAKSMSYDIAAGRQAALTNRDGVNVTLTGTTFQVSLAASGKVLRSATMPAGISLTTTCASSVCRFDKRGRPTVPGTITVTGATGRTYTITIQAGTGRVSISGG